jgi:hypothetical protein
MRRHGQPQHGDGTAWLVVDCVTGDYLCYWYTGTADDRLVEHARVASAEEAVAWGRRRTPRVRIRTPDARTFWAGTAPRPEGFVRTWTQDDAVNAVFPPHTLAGSLILELADEPAGRRPTRPSPSRGNQIGPGEPRQIVGAVPTPSGGPAC